MSDDQSIQSAGDYFWKYAFRAFGEFANDETSIYRAIQASIAIWHVSDATYCYWKDDEEKKIQFPLLAVKDGVAFGNAIADLGPEMALCRDLANAFKHFKRKSPREVEGISSADFGLRTVMHVGPMPHAIQPSFGVGWTARPSVVVRLRSGAEPSVIDVLASTLRRWVALNKEHHLFGEEPANNPS